MTTPTYPLLNTALHGTFLEISDDKRTVRYTGSGSHNNDVGAVQTDCGLRDDVEIGYYEVTILNTGVSGRIGIGFAESSFQNSRQPGWEPASYGYHGDDGYKFHSGHADSYGPSWKTGDVIGCGLIYETGTIFWVHNGTRLSDAFSDVSRTVLPTIGLHSPGESVRINTGMEPWKYDLEGAQAERLEAQKADLAKMPALEPGDLRALIRSYLLHAGYQETLAAFQSGAGDPGDPAVLRSLAARKQVRAAILAGNTLGAMEIVSSAWPSLLENQARLAFALHRQRFVELVAEGDLTSATQFAQNALGPVATAAISEAKAESASAGMNGSSLSAVQTYSFSSSSSQSPSSSPPPFSLPSSSLSSSSSSTSSSHSSPSSSSSKPLVPLEPGEAESHALTETLGLLAYVDPVNSPLGYLLSARAREQVADQVNAAILQADSLSPVSPLERALSQLIGIHRVRRELAGNKGPKVVLRDLMRATSGD